MSNPFAISVSALESVSVLLDQLLSVVVDRIQLTNTQYKLAQDEYGVVHRSLEEFADELADGGIHLFPQGSMRLRTTVRPLRRNEFDLDIVCQLPIGAVGVRDVFDWVIAKLETRSNYAGRLERKAKCIRIQYANEFHLDLIPARENAERGGTSILVGDYDQDYWIENDPIAYANWFDSNARLMLSHRHFQASAEPLAPQEPAVTILPLRRVVQLWKRRRDIVFAGKSFSPASIVLTTLCGESYDGEPSSFSALRAALSSTIARANGPNGRFRLPNPSNPDEDLVRSWTDKDFGEFYEFALRFSVDLAELAERRGIHELVAGMKEMFGEASLPELSTLGHSLRRALDNQTVKRVVAPTILSSTAGGRAIARSTFYGSSEA